MERNRIIDWGLGEDLVEEDLTAGEGDVEENVGVGQEFFSHQIIPRPIRHWNSLSLSLSGFWRIEPFVFLVDSSRLYCTPSLYVELAVTAIGSNHFV